MGRLRSFGLEGTRENAKQYEACKALLLRYADNIVANPTEEKYRRIRLNNAIFLEQVRPVPGAIGTSTRLHAAMLRRCPTKPRAGARVAAFAHQTRWRPWASSQARRWAATIQSRHCTLPATPLRLSNFGSCSARPSN